MAAEVSARVHLVAEKLQLRAQEAQRKGSAGAAAALADSVRDLRQAIALIAEQAHLLACRRGDDEGGDAKDQEDDVEELLAALAKVERMLGKKSDEMKAKGNENAAASLLQSSGAVGLGRKRIAELQQRVYGLQERWEAVAAVINGQLTHRRRSSSAKSTGSTSTNDQSDAHEMNDEHEYLQQNPVVVAARQLVALKRLLLERFPACRSADDFAAAIDSAATASKAIQQSHTDEDSSVSAEKAELALERARALEEQVKSLQAECSRLALELKDTKTQHTKDLALAEKNEQLLRAESAALEESLQKLEQEYNARREQEIANLQSIYDSQRKANEELEQILSEKDDEIANLKKNAQSDGEQIENLRHDVDAMTRESAQNQEEHRRQLEELRQQLEGSRDLLASGSLEESPDLNATIDPPVDPIATDADDAVAPSVEIPPDRLEELKELQTSMTELNVLLETHQGTIASLQHEREQLQRDVDQLQSAVAEKERGMTDLQENFKQQVSKLSQEISARDETIDVLSGQLSNELQSMSDVHSNALTELREELEKYRADHAATTSALEERNAEIASLRRQVSEYDQRQRKTENLAHVSTELQELITILNNDSGETESAVLERLSAKEWTTPSVFELGNAVIAQLDELIALKSQAAALNAQRNEFAADIFALSKLLAESVLLRDGGVVGHSHDVKTHLAWLSSGISKVCDAEKELTQLVDDRTSKCEDLEQQCTQMRTDLNVSRDEKSDLEALISSLKEQVESLKREHAEIQKLAAELQSQLRVAGEQRESQSAATSDKVETLESELAAVRAEFERYRSRSHTALKKMEKRAELLNGMRKENEKLLVQVIESDAGKEEAQSSLARISAQLEELTHSQQQLQQEFEQYVEEKTKVIMSLEEKLQHVTDERDSRVAEVGDLTARLETLEQEKLPMLEATIQEQRAELGSVKATLATKEATFAALQGENKELQATAAGLEAEISKLQMLIQSLEQQAKEQAELTTSGSFRSLAPVPSPPASSKAAPIDVGRAEALEKEIATLRLSRASLEEEASVLRTELMALQEKFATIKAAHAEKVFTLEEQCRTLQAQLDDYRSENGRAAEPRAGKNTMDGRSEAPVLSAELSKLKLDVEAKNEQIARLAREIEQLEHSRDEMRTEVALLTRTADQYKEQLDQLNKLRGSRSTSVDSEDAARIDSTATDEATDKDKAKKSAALMEQSLRHLREEVKRLQDEVHTLREEKEAWEQEEEKRELEELRESRLALQSEKEGALKKQQRKQLVTSFQEQVDGVVKELQRSLEEHAHAFRDACAFRDAHRGDSFLEAALKESQGSKNANSSTRREYEECLVMTSGVVIKAGARFQLPVVCAKQGWRVVWTFKVKEDDADVAFSLTRDGSSDPEKKEALVIVEPQRVASLSGIFEVNADDTTLLFEWDNSFSWLNEKTLDYHVSIQEPLSPEKQQVRVDERRLEAHVQILCEGLDVLTVEADRRAALTDALSRLVECETTRGEKMELLSAWKEEIVRVKAETQERMEEAKVALGEAIRQQDEVEDDVKQLDRVWADAVAEREDVEITLKLSEASQLEELAAQLRELQDALARQREQQQAQGEPADEGGGEEIQEKQAGDEVTEQAEVRE